MGITVNEIIQLLRIAPDSQLDNSIQQLIDKWSDTPSSLQILEVLDRCIFGSLSSGFVVDVLERMLYETLKLENKTLEDILPNATWRIGGEY